MPYVQNQQIDNLSNEWLYTWRTSNNGQNQPSKKSAIDCCTLKLTYLDPFIFRPNVVRKYFKVRRWKNNRWYYSTRSFDFNELVFEKHTRSLREWREIAKTFLSLVDEGVISSKRTPEIYSKGYYLVRKLNKYRKCICGRLRPKMRPPEVQHACTHRKYEWDKPADFIVDEPMWPGVPYTWTSINTQYMGRYNIANETQHELNTPENPLISRPDDYSVYTDWVATARRNLTSDIAIELLNKKSTLAAVLWPSSTDFNPAGYDNAQPLVDVAEAVSDGTILGTPPSPVQAAQLIEDMSGVTMKSIDRLRQTVDFASNTWLWWQLVARPVYSAAVSLGGAVAANDARVEAINSTIWDEKWIQGRSLRVHDKSAETCWLSVPKTFSREYVGSRVSEAFTEEVGVDELESNAQFIYKLGLDNLVTSSGQQLGMFFNSLSTSLEEVMYNLMPLSFVIDWFTKDYSGQLDVKSKTYMNVTSSKLILSVKSRVYFKRRWTAKSSLIYAQLHTQFPGCSGYTWAPQYHFNKTIDDLPDLGPCYGYYLLGSWNMDRDEETTHAYKYYWRNFVVDPPNSPYESIKCQVTSSTPNFGQGITLGALIWSFFVSDGLKHI